MRADVHLNPHVRIVEAHRRRADSNAGHAKDVPGPARCSDRWISNSVSNKGDYLALFEAQ